MKDGCLYSGLQSQFNYSIMMSDCFNVVRYQSELPVRDKICVHKGVISAVKNVESISSRISYITLYGRWCDIIGLNAHIPTKE